MSKSNGCESGNALGVGLGGGLGINRGLSLRREETRFLEIEQGKTQIVRLRSLVTAPYP